MIITRPIVVFLGISALGLIGVRAADDTLSIQHADCPFYGADHDKIVQGSMRGFRGGKLVEVAGSRTALRDYTASKLTEAVVASLGTASGSASTAAAPPPGSRTGTLVDPATSNTIDRYLFPAMAQANVTPAPATTDYEFVRRVTLDLAGHIPTAADVTAFVANTSATKRADYIETLLASPQWADKW